MVQDRDGVFDLVEYVGVLERAFAAAAAVEVEPHACHAMRGEGIADVLIEVAWFDTHVAQEPVHADHHAVVRGALRILHMTLQRESITRHGEIFADDLCHTASSTACKTSPIVTTPLGATHGFKLSAHSGPEHCGRAPSRICVMGPSHNVQSAAISPRRPDRNPRRSRRAVRR